VRQPFVWSEARASLNESKWELAIPVVLILGVASGALRVHEASAFTALYVLVIEVAVYRDLRLGRDLARVIVQSMTLLGAVLAIMVTAIGFNAWMVQAEVPLRLLAWLQGLVDSRLVFLLVLNVLLLAAGAVMDIFTAIVLLVPLIVPLAYAYAIDPYHLAVVFLLNLEIGYLTPPIGLNLFVSSLRFNRSMSEVYRTVVPFICVLVLALLAVTYVPVLSTWLPDRLRVRDDGLSLRAEPSGAAGGR
jgi:tripartite ATP-independent transporter DctM subunit